MIEKIKEVIKGLNICECERLEQKGFTNECFFKNAFPNPENLTEQYTFNVLEKKKYFYLNCGGSGVFMVEKDTGEIFNIKAYGTADKNKKIKADLGNIKDYVFIDNNFLNIDKIKVLHSKRYNYLR